MHQREAIEKARSYFLTEENIYGCAETTFMVMKEAYGLSEAWDSSAAMALNGGIAYSGGMCGAISGAALAVGMLAGRRVADHKEAKRVARRIIAGYMDYFQQSYGSFNCRDLIGFDIRDERQHHQFIESGLWRDRCMKQIEFAVQQLVMLVDEVAWERTTLEVNSNALNHLSLFD